MVSSQFGWFGGLVLGWKQTEVGGGVLGEWSPGQVSIERDDIRVYLYAWAMMCLVIGGRQADKSSNFCLFSSGFEPPKSKNSIAFKLLQNICAISSINRYVRKKD